MEQQDGKVTFESREDLPPTAISVGTTAWNRTGSWKFLEPFYRDRTPPCANVCLTGVDIARMMWQVEEGFWDDAVRTVIETNPFPAVTGRVCPHPCEQPCNRKALGGGVEIHAVERAVGDHKLRAGVRPDLPVAALDRVHVVGSGPAGLSAAVALRRLGHAVTVHDAAPEAGGLLRYGIPAFRLPADVMRAEVAWVRSLGIDVRLGTRLLREDIEALGPTILAVGFGRSRPLGIPGEDLPGVVDGIRLLSAVRRGEDVACGADAAVIGGGNTAMDVARTLLRIGTRPVVWYRRTAREMPAFKEEVEQAKEEGIPLEFLCAPLRIEPSPGGRLLVTFVRMDLGPPDASGRAKPVVRAGSEFQVEVASVVKALGEVLDEEVLPAGARVDGGLVATDESWRTGHEGVHAAGDAAGRLGFTVGEAIRSGRLAAHALHAEMTGAPAPAADPLAERGTDPSVAKFRDLHTHGFAKEAPRVPAMLPPAERLRGFEAVERDLSPEDARYEAARCFKCGTCVECDTCLRYCPDFAIRRKTDGFYEIDLAHCKGCGVCVQECPRDAIHLRKST